jgi:hypothetical protein
MTAGFIMKAMALAGTALALLPGTGAGADTRAAVVNVRAYGASGDGKTDDTAAVQKAVDAAPTGGTVRFPRGVYVVRSVNIRPGLTYRGEKAVIKRPAAMPNWTRTFTTDRPGYIHSGDADSPLTTFEGLTFDGNRDQQAPFSRHAMEQAHLLFLIADPSRRGRLRALVRGCRFQESVADGISVYTNVDVTVRDSTARNCFRGGFVLTGGHSRAHVVNFTTTGDRLSRGIDIEVDGKGYGGSEAVEVDLERLRLKDGRFDIIVQPGSVVRGRDIVAAPPFYLFAPGSTISLRDSRFSVGGSDGYMNRILLPHDVTFTRCTFLITRQESEHPTSHFSGADIWWQHPEMPVQTGQRITFRKCSFLVDKSIRSTDKVYGIHVQRDVPQAPGTLVVEDCHFDGRLMERIARPR